MRFWDMFLGGVITAVITLLLAMILSVLLGQAQRELADRVDSTTHKTQLLLCQLAQAAHVDNPEIAAICAEVLP